MSCAGRRCVRVYIISYFEVNSVRIIYVCYYLLCSVRGSTSIWNKISVGVLYISLFCAIIPTLFPYFLPFWYPYILSHFQMFFITCIYTRGNRTPGSRVATGCDSTVAQARYCNSFQLTHMPREDRASSVDVRQRRSIELSQQWRPKEKTRNCYSAHNIASTVSFGI